jgi:hypothetical protein
MDGPATTIEQADAQATLAEVSSRIAWETEIADLTDRAAIQQDAEYLLSLTEQASSPNPTHGLAYSVTVSDQLASQARTGATLYADGDIEDQSGTVITLVSTP